MTDWYEMADWYEREFEVLTDAITKIESGMLKAKGQDGLQIDEWLIEDRRRRERLPAIIAACRAQAQAQEDEVDGLPPSHHP